MYDPNARYQPRATGIKASIESIHRVICKRGGFVTMSVRQNNSIPEALHWDGDRFVLI